MTAPIRKERTRGTSFSVRHGAWTSPSTRQMTTTAVDAPPNVTSEVGVRKVLTWGSAPARAAGARGMASIQLTGGLRGMTAGLWARRGGPVKEKGGRGARSMARY